MDEQEKIQLEKQLDDPRKDSKKDSKSSKRNLPVATKICRHFAAGKCTRGVPCLYKHVTSKESRVATVNAEPSLVQWLVTLPTTLEAQVQVLLADMVFQKDFL